MQIIILYILIKFFQNLASNKDMFWAFTPINLDNRNVTFLQFRSQFLNFVHKAQIFYLNQKSTPITFFIFFQIFARLPPPLIFLINMHKTTPPPWNFYECQILNSKSVFFNILFYKKVLCLI